MADPYMRRLELESEFSDQDPAGKKRRQDLERRIADYNASVGYYRQQDKPYIIPGEYNFSGWVQPSGKEYVTLPQESKDNAELADTVAHEGLHQQRNMAGVREEKKPSIGGEYVRDQLGHPDFGQLQILRQLLSQQKTFPIPENYNANAEETYATYAGLEGRLPKGTAITSQPEFSAIAQQQRLKNLLFGETSVPYGGVWEGQAPKSAMDNYRDFKRQIKPYQDNILQLIGQLIGTR